MWWILRDILIGIIIAAPIGPVNIEVIRRSLNQGFYSAFLFSLGAIFSDITYLLVIYFGASNFLRDPVVISVMWFFGSIVLIYLGFKSFQDFYAHHRSNLNYRLESSFIAGYLITLSNPMSFLLWFGVFGSFFNYLHQASKSFVLINSFMVIAGIFLWFAGLCLFLRFSKVMLNEKLLHYFSKIAGVFLILFGIYFFYSAIVYLI